MAKTGSQMAPTGRSRGLVDFEPFRELMGLQRNLNRLFDESYRPSETTALNTWTPAVDVYEDEDNFLIKVEMPEVKREDVKVNLDNNTLSISGERRLEHEDKRDGYHRVERSYGQFYRSFSLPPNVNRDAVNAEFRDGILRLTIPKREEAKPKQIEVKIG